MCPNDKAEARDVSLNSSLIGQEQYISFRFRQRRVRLYSLAFLLQRSGAAAFSGTGGSPRQTEIVTHPRRAQRSKSSLSLP
jgi:hypothetical protein